MAYRYFELDSAIAEKMSRYLYSLMYPENESVETIYLFEWKTIGGVDLICVDASMICPLFTKSITTKTLSDLNTELGNRLTTNQKKAFVSYIKDNNNVSLIDLVKTLPERTQAFVDKNLPKL